MADLPILPQLNLYSTGLVAWVESVRQGFLQADSRLDALEGGGGSHTHDATDITSGTLALADVAAGSMIVVDKVKNSGSWPARPTARTDVCVKWVGSTDPGSAAINGDIWSQTP